MLARLLPPPPAHGLAWGRGGAAWVLAMLDGPQALSQGGQRVAERAMRARLQPGLTRAALHDARLGHRRDALGAANRKKVWSAIALTALAVSPMPPPWRPQDTPTMALAGA